ncbi:MAG: DNA methyltransferase [Bacillota bacterium]
MEDVYTQHGTNEIIDLFNDAHVFSFPKPTRLITQLLNLATSSDDDIILDFFAGSGATADAIMKLNKQDNFNRKFILVQLPEPTGRTDFPTIADICKERVRRVINKLNQEDEGKLPLNDAAPQDRGFKVFKLAPSNFKIWNSEPPKGEAELAKQLELHINHILPGRSQEDILTELLLKAGFPLTVKIERLTLAGKTVFSIAEGAMLICPEHELTLELIKEMAGRKPQRVICLDEGFAGNDQLKTNAALIFEANGVLKFQTV